MARPLLLLAAAAAAAALLTGHAAHAFAVGPNPNPAQRPAPTSPYERRDRPMDADEAAAPAPFVLGPGSRVAVVGADSGALGRLVTKKLFMNQFRPYLMVKDLAKVPSGLGLDQYKVRVYVVCV